jgi:zinc transport system substrate-binding protein
VRIAHALCGLTLLSLGLVCGACTRKSAPRFKIAVTIFPVYDLTRTVAGPDADVFLLVPPGVSVHDAIAAFPRANAVAGTELGIMVGLGLDDWMQALLVREAPSAHRLIVGDRVPTIPIRQSPFALFAREGEHEIGAQAEGNPDPHVWLDPERAMLISKAIAEEMARVDPTHAVGYRSRSFALQQRLDALDREIEGRVATWASRSFISFHPAFAYYADRYHLDVPASIEPAAGIAPPRRYLEEVVRIVETQKIAGVFREPQLPPEAAAVVAHVAGVPLGVLDPIGGQVETDTYDKLLRFDTDALEKVLRVAPSANNAAGSPPR